MTNPPGSCVSSRKRPFEERTETRTRPCPSRRLVDVFKDFSETELNRLNNEAIRASGIGTDATSSSSASVADKSDLHDMVDLTRESESMDSHSQDLDRKPAALPSEMDSSAGACSEKETSTTASCDGRLSIKDLEQSLGLTKPPSLSKKAWTARLEEMIGPRHVDEPYTWEEFEQNFVNVETDYFGMEILESTPAVRNANTRVEKYDSGDQTRAQYGRTMSLAGERIFEIGNLTKDKIFLDIGHGIGNLVFQAAYTVGCESRGIELSEGRFNISDAMRIFYDERHRLFSESTREMRAVGQVKLRHGQLQQPEHRGFLTNYVDLAYCNNFGEVFSSRSNNKSVTYTLDDYVAGLLTQLKEGAKLITLFELKRLPPSVTDANAHRKQVGLTPSPKASFYELEVIDDSGGAEKLTWTNKGFKYYVYTRVGEATFLCCNPQCTAAKKLVPIEASQLLAAGKDNERLISVVHCEHCDGKEKPKRGNKTKPDYFKPG